MPAFLPPSSNDTLRTPLAAAPMMASPVRVSPVKVIASTSGMARQELAGRIGAETMHDVVDTGRHADGVHHLAEQRRGGRCLFGRLHHHGVAAGERGADLPRHEQQRQVPRADHRDDPERRCAGRS